jgi:hypothetical protein
MFKGEGEKRNNVYASANPAIAGYIAIKILDQIQELKICLMQNSSSCSVPKMRSKVSECSFFQRFSYFLRIQRVKIERKR